MTATMMRKLFCGHWLLWVVTFYFSSNAAFGAENATHTVSTHLQTGHQMEADALAFTPDGKLLITGGKERIVKIWDVENKREVATAYKHVDSVKKVQVAPDGKTFASLDISGFLKIFDLSRATELELDAADKKIVDFYFLQSNELVAVLYSDYTMAVWRMQNGAYVATPAHVGMQVTAMTFSSALEKFYLVDQKSRVYEWAVEGGKPLLLFDASEQKNADFYAAKELTAPEKFSAIRVDESTAMVLLANPEQLNGGVVSWSLATTKPVWGVSGDANDMDTRRGVVLISGVTYVASLGRPTRGGVFDATNGKYLKPLQQNQSTKTYGAALNRDSTLAAYSLATGAIVLKKLDKPDALADTTMRGYATVAMGVQHVSYGDKGYVWVANEDALSLWSAIAPDRLLRVSNPDADAPIGPFAATPDGQRVFFAAGSNAYVYDRATGRTARFGTHESEITGLDFSLGENRILTVSADGKVRAWQQSNQEMVENDVRFLVLNDDKELTRVQLSSDGMWLYRSSGKKVLGKYMGAESKWREFVVPTEGMISHFTLLPDGRRLLAAVNSTRRWVAPSGALLLGRVNDQAPKQIAKFDSLVTAMRLHPNGLTVAVALDSGEVKLVSLMDGTVESTVVVAKGALTGVDFAQDGQSMVVTDIDGTWYRVPLSGTWTTRSASMSDGNWLAMTPEGYFQSSGSSLAEGISLVQGYIGRSLLDFYDVFHRPDIVQAKLLGEDISKLVGDLTIEKALQNPPPKVTLPTLLSPSVGLERRVKVPYSIKSEGGGIAEVRVFHNGKLVMSDGAYKDALGRTLTGFGATKDDAIARAVVVRGINRQTTASESAAAPRQIMRAPDIVVRTAKEKTCDPCVGTIEVEAIPGEENVVSVVASNRDNTIQSRAASIGFMSTLPKEAPKLWILGVGIDRFQSIKPNLKNAAKDAYDFACIYAGAAAVSKLSVFSNGLNSFTKPCAELGTAVDLFKPENIHVVDVLFDEQASKRGVQVALDQIAANAKPQDTFVWFVASHGMMDANSVYGIVANDTICTKSDAKGLCTDVAGHLTSNDILEASKKIKAMKQLMVLDTCHSGGLDSKMSGLYDARMSLLAKNMGLHMYASAQATETAQDGIPGTNGTFTAQLLAGIKGAAPKNSEGQISVMTLGQYAKQKTIEATQPKSGAKDVKPAQTPVIQHFGQDAGLVGVGR